MGDFIEWNLNLGHDDIDGQHQALVTDINQLAAMATKSPVDVSTSFETPSSGSKEAAIHQLLNEMMQHVQDHFQYEEQLMAELGYPELIDHKREHTMLAAELKLFMRDIERNPEALDCKALGELKSWLMGHVLERDKALVAYIDNLNELNRTRELS